jgi:hypothetical protein
LQQLETTSHELTVQLDSTKHTIHQQQFRISALEEAADQKVRGELERQQQPRGESHDTTLRQELPQELPQEKKDMKHRLDSEAETETNEADDLMLVDDTDQPECEAEAEADEAMSVDTDMDSIMLVYDIIMNDDDYMSEDAIKAALEALKTPPRESVGFANNKDEANYDSDADDDKSWASHRNKRAMKAAAQEDDDGTK